MSTNTPSRHLRPFLVTMLFGVVMATLIWAFGSSELAWLGFVLAATLSLEPSSRACVTRFRAKSRA